MGSPLLQLPTELRMMVYTAVAVLVCESPLHPATDGELSIAGLLATNKQIYHEARGLLYEKNKSQLTAYDDQELDTLPGPHFIPNLKVV